MLGWFNLRRCLMSVSYSSLTFLTATCSPWYLPMKTAPWAPEPSHWRSCIASNGISQSSMGKRAINKKYRFIGVPLVVFNNKIIACLVILYKYITLCLGIINKGGHTKIALYMLVLFGIVIDISDRIICSWCQIIPTFLNFLLFPFSNHPPHWTKAANEPSKPTNIRH